MKIKNNKICLLISLLLACLFVINPVFAAETPTYDKIVFFGDSLTDTGNMYSVSLGFLPKSPPYHQGRFSNGVVWSEQVSAYFNQKNVSSSNYAIGGLTSILHNPFKGFLPYSLTGSMYDYLVRSVFTDKSTTLFVIWIGSNDYLQGTKNTDSLTTNVVTNIKHVIENLIYYGGKNFLIINLPDLAVTPYSKAYSMNDVLSKLSQLHNNKLNSIVTELKSSYKNTNIQLFDSGKLLTESLANLDATNKKYASNIKNINEACWTGGYTLKNEEPSSESTIRRDLEEQMNKQFKSAAFTATLRDKSLDTAGFASYIANSPALFETYSVGRRVNELGQTLAPCNNPNEYVFWDRIHPSAVIHRIFAINIIDFINTHYQPVTKV